MDSKPFFSIIIPSFNRAEFISEAIQSVLNQTFKDFELIVVNDGSTDGTHLVVEDFKDARIRYFWKVNEERNLARNFGLSKAKGKYVGFLDSDDIYADIHLETAFQIISNNSDFRWFYFGEIKKYSAPQLNHQFRKKLIIENYFSINGVIVESDLFQQISFLDSKFAVVGEDHYLWLRLAARFPIYIHSQQTTFFKVHPERSLNKVNLQLLIVGTEEIILSLKRDREFMEYFGREAHYYFAFKYTYIALVANNYQNYTTSISMILMAIFHDVRIIVNRRFLASVKNLIIGKISLLFGIR